MTPSQTVVLWDGKSTIDLGFRRCSTAMFDRFRWPIEKSWQIQAKVPSKPLFYFMRYSVAKYTGYIWLPWFQVSKQWRFLHRICSFPQCDELQKMVGKASTIVNFHKVFPIEMALGRWFPDDVRTWKADQKRTQVSRKPKPVPLKKYCRC
jgi:hypothetical protein